MKRNKSAVTIPSLTEICLKTLGNVLEENRSNARIINEVCKRLPSHFLDPLMEDLLQKKNVITDASLLQFLVVSRSRLLMPGVVHIRNSTLKQIGYNCPNLVISA